MENKISAADAVLTTVPNPRTAGQRKLSGHTYVPMRLRGSDGLRTSPTLVRDESRCGHLHTICVTCHADWETDYEVLYHRTIAGRKLLARLQAIRAARRPDTADHRLTNLDTAESSDRAGMVPEVVSRRLDVVVMQREERAVHLGRREPTPTGRAADRAQRALSDDRLHARQRLAEQVSRLPFGHRGRPALPPSPHGNPLTWHLTGAVAG